MLKNLSLSRLKIALTVAAVFVLASCGGGSGNDAASGQQAISPNAQSTTVSSATSAKPRGALQGLSNNGRAIRQPNSSDYHPTRVLARLLDTPQAKTAAASTMAASFSSMGLRQMTGFSSGLSGQAKQSGQSSSASPLAIFEITQPGVTVPQAVEQLMRSGLVAYAEPDYYLKQRIAPNDPSYGIYWHLKNTGQAGGAVGNDINAEAAWNISTGTGAMVVAVMDSGVMYDHPDLAPNMWSSAGTPRSVVPGDPSGATGVVDDFNGADLSIDRGASTTVRPYSANPASDHGTMVSGFVGATGNNSVGGTGVNWNVKIMGIKIEGPTTPGGAANSSFANGIRYMIAKKRAGVNVRIINISYGGSFPSQAYKEALEEANAAGILVIVAAGNDGSNDERDVGYPSSYKTPNLISVGALDRTNARASFSNYGNLVHLFAPGANVPTTSSLANPPSGAIAPYYRFIDGTSFASPIVAGAAALVWMQYPNETAAQIKARLLNSTTPFLSTAESMTSGKLNLAAAMASTVPCSAAAPVMSELASQMVAGATHKVSAYVKTCSTTSAVNAIVNGVATQIKDDGVYPDEYANDGYFSGTFVAPAMGGASQLPVSVSVQDTAAGALASSSLNVLHKRAVNYSHAATAFAWDTPSTVADYGNAAGDFDDGVLARSPAFPIQFDGRSISTVYVSTNGYVCMDDPLCISGTSYPLPTGKLLKPLGSTQAIVAPWWHDWNVGCAASDIFVENLGFAPNRRFVVTWSNALPHYTGFDCATAVPDYVSFQVVFYEGSGNIDFRYQDVSTFVPGSATNPSGGARGSSGIQLSGGKQGTQFTYNTASSLAASTARRFSPTNSSFTDVFAADFFAVSVEGLKGSIITTGCSTTLFCAEVGRGTPDAQIKTTQQQMAAFLARAINGHDRIADYTPYAASGFTDVFSTFTRYVNFLKARGIMTGTGTSATLFCNPDCNNDFVTRAQMARYLVKSVRGSAYVPPPATGVFSDVPASHPEAAFIEEVARMKITLGTGAGLYSPEGTVTRGQMATFLQRTFRPFDQY